jgi:pimeloyl-ACP methyl ester carboxylesterase
MPTLQVRGTRVEYLEQGSGEPVVLLHGSASSSAQWRPLVERLGQHYRVVAPDLWGYGATASWTGEGEFSLRHEAEIVVALLDRLDEPAHLVGHSYGGAVALHVARRHRARVASLALIEPVAFHLLKDGSEADRLALLEITDVAAGLGRSLTSGDYAGGIGRFVDYWNGPGSWSALPPEKRAPMAARLSKVLLDFHATFNEPADLQDFGSLALPAFVARGDRTVFPARRICERLSRGLRGSRVAIIEGAGHMAPLTHRDQVNALIAGHLNAVSCGMAVN